MDIKRAKQEIKDSIEAYLTKDEFGAYRIPAIRQRPVLLMGPPGIGKTQIMEQIAKECKIGLVAYTITHHTRQSAVGLPFIKEKIYGGQTYSVTEYTMSEIIASVYEKIEQTGIKEGILFIDEINCVSETLAPTMLQFLQGKTFGNQKIPQGWIIVAAGNPPEYNKSVREFDIVTLDRIKKINVEANLDVWKEYAYKQGIHPAVISYLELRKQNFYRIETTVDGKAFATARGWEDLSQLIQTYEVLGKTIDRDVIAQYIQHKMIAKDFANYLELFYKYRKDYGVEDILEEGSELKHCITGKDTYYERIAKRESYLLFLRKTEAHEKPYYTLEVEPNGTVRQKRTYYDRQNADIEQAKVFLLRWQKQLTKKLNKEDKILAFKSRDLRKKEIEELRKNKVKVNGFGYQGKLLADILEEDLMEAAA